MTKCFLKFQIRTNIPFPLNFIYYHYFKASYILLLLSLENYHWIMILFCLEGFLKSRLSIHPMQ